MQRGILRHRNRVFVIPTGLSMVGRHRSCSFLLDDPSVSRQHALLIHDHGIYTLMDYKSSNGVKVNGDSIFRQELRPGDELTIGEVVCEFTVETALEGRWRENFENFDGAFVAQPFLRLLERATRFTMVKDPARFRFLLDAAKDLSEAVTPRDVGIRAMHAALVGLGASRGFLALRQQDDRCEVVTSIGIAPEKIARIPFYTAMVSRAQSSQVLVRTTTDFAEYVHHEPRLVFEDIGSALACPLLGTRGVLAGLYIDRPLVDPVFGPAEDEPLAVLAHGLGMALETSMWRAELEEGLGAMEILGAGTQSMGILCGVCGEAAQLGSREVVVCQTCNAVHHRDCWEYNLGCARFACGSERHQSLGIRVADLQAFAGVAAPD